MYSQAPSIAFDVALIAVPPPVPTNTNGFPSSDGNCQRATFSKSPSIGVAPVGPQSKVHCQSPPVQIASLPCGKAWYLVGSQGFGFSISSTVNHLFFASVW